MACGTGSCACVVAGVLTGRTDRKVTVSLPGGDLLIEWREEDNCLYMTGPAVAVFEGVVQVWIYVICKIENKKEKWKQLINY